MRRIRPDVDIILDILTAVAEAYPGNAFAQSIWYQYQERGGLSKKQLQGLYAKAKKTKGISPARLATLEAIILKKPTKDRTPLPKNTAPIYQKNETVGSIITTILEKYPGHKRVLFLRAKYENNEPLNATELAELQKFARLLK
jgi:hypothetical protein